MSEKQTPPPDPQKIQGALSAVSQCCKRALLNHSENTEMQRSLYILEAVCRDHDRFRNEAVEAKAILDEAKAIIAANAVEYTGGGTESNPVRPKTDDAVASKEIKSISVEGPELARLADLDAPAKAFEGGEQLGGEQLDGVVGDGLPVEEVDQ